MSCVGCLLPDSELFILFAENSQILLKIFVIPILLTFTYLVALDLLINKQTHLIVQLDPSLRHLIVTLIIFLFRLRRVYVNDGWLKLYHMTI